MKFSGFKIAKLITFLRILFYPSIWMLNDEISQNWDAELNQLLDTEKFESKGQYIAKLGNRHVWIENHPYASFTPYDRDVVSPRVSPRRATILKARKKLLLDVPSIF